MSIEIHRTVSKRPWNPVVINVHINMFLYALCYLIQANTLPYLSKSLGVNAVWFGYLQTLIGFIQLIGGPLFGRFGDIFGSRAALSLAFLASAVAYGMLGIAYSVTMLFLSSIPTVFQHSMQGGQMVITDLSEEADRADALGKLWLSYGIGSVVGPFIGGHITERVGERPAALVAAAGSLVSVVLVMLIPKHTKKEVITINKQESTDSTESHTSQRDGVFNIRKLLELVMIPSVGMLLTVKTLASVPFTVFSVMFPVVAMEKFQVTADVNGYILSYFGVLTMLSQGFGVGFLTRRFSDNSLMKWCFFVCIWSYLAMTFSESVWLVCVISAPVIIANAILVVVTTSAMTKPVSEADTGAILGLSMAVDSLARTISPAMGGLLLHHLGFYTFGVLGVVISAGVSILLFARLKD